MPSANEKEAMTIIADEGGECKVGKVAAGMGLSTDYTRIILESLGRNEYLDVYRSGNVELKAKGYKAIGREPDWDAQWRRELEEKFDYRFEG